MDNKGCILKLAALLLIIVQFAPHGICEDLKFQTFQTFGGEDDWNHAGSSFKFASYYSDHMVLQRAPLRSNVWGYASLEDIGQQVSLTLSGQGPDSTYQTTIQRGPFTDKAVWGVQLSPVSAGGPYTITTTIMSSFDTITLRDVLFGDVWICSGQSNMKFSLEHIFNATEELEAAASYSSLRVMMVGENTSDIPLFDLEQIQLPWSLPRKVTVAHFSAVCWLYGRKIFEKLNYPIGLIESVWGGTPVEAWSSPEALAKCGLYQSLFNDEEMQGVNKMEVGGPPHAHSSLWNAMIHPLINLTVYGAIWYQGEANALYPVTYNCTFPAMISDWRSKFTGHNVTKQEFPFGFVQLAPHQNDSSITTGFPDIRWHQTADFGYVPNPREQNVFMAVAMDLPDFTSPHGSIHPRDKEDVTTRLALSGLTVAYKMKQGQFQGPRPSAYYMDLSKHTLQIEFDSGRKPIQVRSNHGFEICCSPDNQTYCDLPRTKWEKAPIISNTSTTVTLTCEGCQGMFVKGLRYAWRESPCPFKKCAVYSVDNELPMPPFLTSEHFGFNVIGRFKLSFNNGLQKDEL